MNRFSSKNINICIPFPHHFFHSYWHWFHICKIKLLSNQSLFCLLDINDVHVYLIGYVYFTEIYHKIWLRLVQTMKFNDLVAQIHDKLSRLNCIFFIQELGYRKAESSKTEERKCNVPCRQDTAIPINVFCVFMKFQQRTSCGD